MDKSTTIWVQSCSAESDAAIWGKYQESARRHSRKLVRPGLSVEFHGLSRTYPGIDYLEGAVHFATGEVVRNAIRAEQAGYAAFAFISTNDAGNREVREITGIPSAFISETATHAAADALKTRGGKFAFLTHNIGSRLKLEQLTIERYGLGSLMVEGASVGHTYNDFAGMYREPAPILAQFEAKAREAIARGATVLIPAGGPLNMFFVDHGLQQVDGVPLVDIMAVVLKEAERLADAGARRPQLSTVSPDQREKLRALFLEAAR